MTLDRVRDDIVERLFQGILSLDNMDICNDFFEDLLTKNEILSIAQRLEVARLLKNGHTYQQIEGMTGASTATISRVRRAVQKGHGAISTVLDQISNN